MIATIQRITTTWTKASRGAPKSAQRAAVPERFPIPPAVLPAKAKRIVVFQKVEASEHEDFIIRDHSEVMDLGGRPDFSDEPAATRFEDGRLRVWYRPGTWSVGAPDRRGINLNVFNLEPGQWGRLIFNGRFGYGGGWAYHRQVFNIACSLEAPGHDRFASEPDFTISDEQDLR
jgi:hypothetical protein